MSEIRFWNGAPNKHPEIAVQTPNLATQGRWAVYATSGSSPRKSQLTNAEMAADPTWIPLKAVSADLANAVTEAVTAAVAVAVAGAVPGAVNGGLTDVTAPVWGG
ncbi:hypothetical protein SEA_AVATARAHPEG_17 [Mycobacterium phage AvatarAhPeg]|uniref:Minor tail protein n=1 Tax=Mycobacterium phage Stink TaxID=3136630 RepID=A0AAU8GQI2_9VIRU|nr:hypothetical protein SEA_AVATARAHPEG_17 [Mycobacterium phage AvatarAhPeg]